MIAFAFGLAVVAIVFGLIALRRAKRAEAELERLIGSPSLYVDRRLARRRAAESRRRPGYVIGRRS